MKTPLRSFLTILVIAALCVPAALWAAPREVILYPQSAKIVDVTRVTLQPFGSDNYKAVVHLPGQAQPETLTASLPRNTALAIDDQSWKAIQHQDEAKLAELRLRLQALKAERIGIVAGIQSYDAQIKYWQEPAKSRAKTPEETGAMAELLTRNIKQAFQDKLSLEPELERTDKGIREMEAEIVKIGGQQENTWEVTFLLSGNAALETQLTLTYLLNGCGWTPLYRLEAVPRDGLVIFTWEAEIWQSSGSDWNQVAVSLATLSARPALAPPELPDWVIRPRTQPQARANEIMGRSMAAAYDQPLAAAPETAQELRQSTYSLWSIGVRNIPAGSRPRLKIRFESWAAEFLHLLRPSVTPDSFIQASVKLPEAWNIPAGQATFLIDGAILAKRPFQFSGQEGLFTFGADPLVTAETMPLSRKSGEKGIFVDRQTQEWSWRYDIKNARDTDVRIRLEEPLPQLRDERIRLSLDSAPEVTERDTQTLIWLLDMPGGDKQSVTHTVRIDAPQGMDLDLGWRR